MFLKGCKLAPAKWTNFTEKLPGSCSRLREKQELPLYLHFALMLHLSGLLLHSSQVQSFFGMSWMEERGERKQHRNWKVWRLQIFSHQCNMTVCLRYVINALSTFTRFNRCGGEIHEHKTSQKQSVNNYMHVEPVDIGCCKPGCLVVTFEPCLLVWMKVRAAQPYSRKATSNLTNMILNMYVHMLAVGVNLII